MKRVAAPLAIAAAAIVLALLPRPSRSARDGRARVEAPCPADVLAELGDAREGAAIAGFHVERVRCEEPRVAALTLARGDTTLVITVAAAGVFSFAPPATTARAAIFYSYRAGKQPSAGETQAVVDAIAADVRAAESRAPKPDGW